MTTYRRHSTPAHDDNNHGNDIAAPEHEKREKAQKRSSWEPSSPRIPKSLQNVFLASARGKEIIEPPKDKSAMKSFRTKFSGGGKKSSTRALKQQAFQKAVSLPYCSGSPSNSFSDLNIVPADAHHSQEPQAYLDKLLASRGYSTRKYESLSCAYHCKPTELQQASYGIQVVKAVRDGDIRLLKTLLDAGLSPTPCNIYGESLMHLVCRRGDHDVLDALLQYGCSLQISDDYGRTPLHDACWTSTPNFETIRMILDEDIHLLYITDARGATPLSYISKETWPIWIKFLDSVKDDFWPFRDVKVVGYEEPPYLTQRGPHTMPVRDPPNALEIDVAFKVAAGQIKIRDLLYCLSDDDDDDDDDEHDDASVSSTEVDEDSSSSRQRSISLDYDDAGFLTPEEIAMTLAKYDDAKFLKDDYLVEAVSNVRTSSAGIMDPVS